jgi:hypothetical protein
LLEEFSYISAGFRTKDTLLDSMFNTSMDNDHHGYLEFKEDVKDLVSSYSNYIDRQDNYARSYAQFEDLLNERRTLVGKVTRTSDIYRELADIDSRLKELLWEIMIDLRELFDFAYDIFKLLWLRYGIEPRPYNNSGYNETLKQVLEASDDLRCFYNVAGASRINYVSGAGSMVNTLFKEEAARKAYEKALESSMTVKGIGDERLRDYNRSVFIHAWKIINLGDGILRKVRAAVKPDDYGAIADLHETYDLLSRGMFVFFKGAGIFKVGAHDHTEDIRLDYLNRINN